MTNQNFLRRKRDGSGRRWLALLLCAALSAVWAAGAPVQAQDQNGGGQDGQNQQLPEIAPREIEIRGELQINFPSLERQPLTGFETATTVPTFPPDHLPSTEPYKQELNELPQSLPEVQTVSSRLESAPDPATGVIEAGGGRYFRRFAEARLTFPVSRYEAFRLRGSYDGSDGYEPFDDRSVTTPYDDLSGGLEFESRRSTTIFRAGVHGFYDDYTLYGAVPIDPALIDTPERTASSIGGEASFRTRGRVPVSIGLTYDRTQYDTQVEPDSIADPLSFDEGRLGARAGVEFPVGPSTVQLDAEATTYGLDGGGALDGDVWSVDAGGSGLVVKQGGFRVDAGVRSLIYRAQVGPTAASPGEVTAAFLSPTVDAEWASGGFTVYARNAPHLATHDLAGIYADNPFAEHAPTIRPNLYTTDAETGVEVAAGPVRVKGRVGYKYAPTFRYFGPSPSSQYGDGLFGVEYASAQIIHGGGSIALHGVSGLQASLGLSVRDGSLAAGNRPIPNFAPLTVDGMLTYRFAGDRAFLKLTGTVFSPRPVDTTGETDVGTYADVDVEGSFEVSSLLDVVARVENLGATERWSRYPRPPAVVSAGVRIHW